MPSGRLHHELSAKILLLRQVVELLMWELSAISNRTWEDFPELKKKKAVLADSLRQYDWTPGPPDLEPLDLAMLRSQISDLEQQATQKFEMQLELLRGRIDSSPESQPNWLECVNRYSRQGRPPASAPQAAS
jgi:hypothetical protein